MFHFYYNDKYASHSTTNSFHSHFVPTLHYHFNSHFLEPVSNLTRTFNSRRGQRKYKYLYFNFLYNYLVTLSIYTYIKGEFWPKL